MSCTSETGHYEGAADDRADEYLRGNHARQSQPSDEGCGLLIGVRKRKTLALPANVSPRHVDLGAGDMRNAAQSDRADLGRDTLRIEGNVLTVTAGVLGNV